MLWLTFVVNHALLDIDPYLLLVWTSTLVLAFPEREVLPRRYRPRSTRARAVVWLSLAGFWSMLAQDNAQILAIVVLSIGLLLMFWHECRLHVRDRFAGVVGLLLLVQVFAALVPLVFTSLNRGTLLAREMAYSFCEPGDNGKLFAAVRSCGLIRKDGARVSETLASCDGKIVEYENSRLAKRAEHRFSPRAS